MRLRWPSADEHRTILFGLMSVGLFSILGKFAMGLKEIAVAWRFGVSAQVDAYLFVFNLMSWPIAVWFSTLTLIVIPLEAKLRKDSQQHLQQFRGELLGLTVLIGGALVLIARFGLAWLVKQPSVGLPPGTMSLTLEMIPRLAWLALPGMLIGLISTWMMSDGRYANTLLEGIPAVCILLTIFLVGSIQAMVWATLGGTLLQLAALIQSRQYRGAFFKLSSSAWTPFWQAFGVMILGQALMSVTTLVDQFFAVGLGEGAISSLGYAGRVLSLANSIVATAVARATLPIFSKSNAAGEINTRRIARHWAAIMGAVGLLSVIIGWVLAPEVVRILFQRGTFTPTDTEYVAMLLRYGLFQLPFYFASLVYVSLHSSRGDYKVLMMSALLGLAVKSILVACLIGRLGAKALLISTAVMYAGNSIWLLLAGGRRKIEPL
jgi:putative peptidoglycan lipid II flippase